MVKYKIPKYVCINIILTHTQIAKIKYTQIKFRVSYFLNFSGIYFFSQCSS